MYPHHHSVVFFLRDKGRSTIQAEQTRYIEAADSAARTFLHNVQSMQSVAFLMNTEARLRDKVLHSSLYNDLQAMQILKSYNNTLPITISCGLYTAETPKLIYFSDAIWIKSIYNQSLNLQEGVLDTVLSCPKSINFSPWPVNGDFCLCTTPLIHDAYGNPKRVAVFQLSSYSLISSFSGLADTINGSRVAAIWDSDGSLIFYNSDSGAALADVVSMKSAPSGSAKGDLYFCNGSYGGYGVLICAPYSEYLACVQSYNTSLIFVLVIALLLCVILIMTFSHINYRPLSRLMDSIGIQSGHKSGYEYGLIRDAYASNRSQIKELTLKGKENEMLLISYALEKLLNDIQPNASDVNIIGERFLMVWGSISSSFFPFSRPISRRAYLYPACQTARYTSSIWTTMGLRRFSAKPKMTAITFFWRSTFPNR